jgi:hypothetical protein
MALGLALLVGAAPVACPAHSHASYESSPAEHAARPHLHLFGADHHHPHGDAEEGHEHGAAPREPALEAGFDHDHDALYLAVAPAFAPKSADDARVSHLAGVALGWQSPTDSLRTRTGHVVGWEPQVPPKSPSPLYLRALRI